MPSVTSGAAMAQVPPEVPPLSPPSSSSQTQTLTTSTATKPPQPSLSPPPHPPRIAILLNSYRSRLLPAIRASYERTIGEACPGAQLAFYEPANRAGDFPDPAYFDLIVFGGSNVDPRKSHPWILDVHAFLRRLVVQHPAKKVLGICWGHQTISRVFGGEVVDAKVPEMGVASINLTEAGRQFFPSAATLGSIRLQQHHRREVAAAPPAFVHLAAGNQCLLSDSNTVLTFQGHPEKDAETARLRMHDTARWYGFDSLSDEKAWARLEAMIMADHDGPEVWRRVIRWVWEPPVLGTGFAERASRM